MWEGFVTPILILSSVGGNSLVGGLCNPDSNTIFGRRELWEGFVVGGNSLVGGLCNPDSNTIFW